MKYLLNLACHNILFTFFKSRFESTCLLGFRMSFTQNANTQIIIRHAYQYHPDQPKHHLHLINCQRNNHHSSPQELGTQRERWWGSLALSPISPVGRSTRVMIPSLQVSLSTSVTSICRFQAVLMLLETTTSNTPTVRT